MPRMLIPALAMMLVAAMTGVADTIVVDGETYSGVKIRESETRYYWRAPDGRAMSVSKDQIAPGQIRFGDGPLADEPPPSEPEPAAAQPEPVFVAAPVPVEMPGPAPVRAGAASAPLLRAGLGGLEANALVLEAGGNAVAFVALDLAAVDGPVVEGVARRLQEQGSAIARENLVVAATGCMTRAQGGVLQGVLEQAVFGEYDAEAARQIIGAAAAAIREAEANLAPAVLQLAEAEVPGLLEQPAGAGASLDSTLNVLRAAAADGTPLAYLVNFPLYSIAGPGGHVEEGRGAPGALDAALEQAAGTEVAVLFMNGAGADTATASGQGENAMGEALARAALSALETAPGRDAVALACLARTAQLPPTLLAGVVPEQVMLHEIHVDNAVLATLPGAASASIAMLLRVKALQGGLEPFFALAHANGFLGQFPSINGYFAGDVSTQVSFYGPLASKWFAEQYLVSDDATAAWRNLPALAKFEATFEGALQRGAADRETIQEHWQRLSAGMNPLTGFLRNASGMLGNDVPPEARQMLEMLQKLDDAQVQAIMKQVAATLFRAEFADFSEEQRVILMGVADGAQIPFDAAVLMQALSQADQLPAQVQAVLQLATAQGGDLTGHNLL